MTKTKHKKVDTIMGGGCPEYNMIEIDISNKPNRLSEAMGFSKQIKEPMDAFYSKGFKDGKKQFLEEVDKIINEFIDKFTIKSPVPKSTTKSGQQNAHFILLRDFNKRIAQIKKKLK